MNGELSGGKIGNNEPMKFSTADITLSFIMLVCGFLYWNLIRIESLGLGVALFTAVLCITSIVYFKMAGFHLTKESSTFLWIIALLAVNFILSDALVIKFLSFILLSLCFVYWVCITAGMRLENKLSLYMISDMLRQLFVIPFLNFTGCSNGVRQVLIKNQKGRGLLSGILGILLFLPVLILVVTLLTDADAAFESLMDHLQFTVSENVLEYIRDMILGLPVAFYLYGLLYGNRYRRGVGKTTLKSVDRQLEVLRFAPGVTVFSALTALNLVYLVFFAAQATYLFSAFHDNLPEAMTYAGYARRGFFELCAVSGINLAVIGGAQLIVKRDKVKILKGETAALCIFTIALIATAMSKMGLYISYYGLTILRVYTSWFMILLLFLFVIILLRQFRSFQGTKLAVIGCICLFLALCYGNADGMIAKYNIDRYQSGTLETLDVSALSELSAGAVPYLYDLYQETEDPVLKAKLKEAIRKPLYDDRDSGEDFRDFNLQKHKANQIRNQI